MIVWRGWGVLAFGIAALAMMFFGGVASTVIPDSAMPFSIAIGAALAAVATWFTGVALNRTSPQRKLDIWVEERSVQLRGLVETGRFSLGPGQWQPTSLEEAREMAAGLLEHETEQMRGIFNQHTLFWIPVQYWAFAFGAGAIVALVAGVVGALR